MNVISSPEELALAVGENIKTLRLQKNLTQHSLAEQAGVSMTALRHLESGQGANLFTLIRIVRALDKQEWLQALAPRVTINPLHMTSSHTRQRARQKKRIHGEKKP
jgi:transcriptional regulator with XRE-family HTH domain